MSISIRSNGVALTSGLRSWISDRVELAVERLGRRSQQVHVYFADQNGPNRGGNDKVCRVVVHMAHESSLVIEDRGDNIGALVERVADRVSALIDKRIEKRKTH